MEEYVIWVDENDQEIGTGEKMATHVAGQLHRAFSVVIFNSQGEMLLQQRTLSKYHSGGLWSNTCCGHPRPGERTLVAGRRRLMEEFGFECDLEEAFTFIYTAQFDTGLTENEYDHVLCMTCDDIVPQPAPDEIATWRWVSLADLLTAMLQHPEQYTYWFKILMTHSYWQTL